MERLLIWIGQNYGFGTGEAGLPQGQTVTANAGGPVPSIRIIALTVRERDRGWPRSSPYGRQESG